MRAGYLKQMTKPILNPMRLTRLIFNYWVNWVSVGRETTLFSLSCDQEGLFWHDGHNATFWYMLNVSWYVMNDKLYAFKGCKEPFDTLLNDLIRDY